MQVEVTDADREAAATIRCALYRADGRMPSYPVGVVEPYLARHRIAERERVVGEIVAWLREEQAATEQLRDEMDRETEGWRYADEHASAIEQSAYAIEAKFGGRDVAG